MSATKRIVVFGGNGFLGSRICRAAVARNWDVTSVSRSGRPNWLSITSSSAPPNWSHSVTWERGDIFRPAQWTSLLHGADYVVHSLGILLEADYKGVISGQESPFSGLRRAFGPAPGAANEPANPLERVRRFEEGEKGGRGEGGKGAPQLTYEMMNRDSTILLAKEAAKAGVGAFGFVSAAAGAPVLPARYLSTKREAEAVVEREFPGMRGVFFRPPFMYDKSRGVTMGVAAMATAGSPLKVDAVADAVVEALADESVKGPVEVPQLEQLAEKAWRKTML
ncbi:hypothetical protein CHGG_02971 [Chaetomium globosum CBS 148.51]|uniref:NAD-dependent epimerase/dehydratase domain-containing protein n=1 Tax=Chaetomium globosum (strain ATCC 6205 / CBS 148.51 / DSM 1962 / NBRC 6347 / NRRL 1970) TaxID=306901 RepID=Q2H9Y3_CHAGB|nr:uncharacterized protein CHGG_02971 [Chaetomium globosum CBS 148.51]EAQ91036.1 hypothetical protein CHGG_02971 [Chaetomium globosum CBS 148.51]